MVQLGAPHSEIVLPPQTPTEPYPQLPVEVDDRYILPHQILGQPEGVVSLLTGFNQAVKIYMTMDELVRVELSYGASTLPFQNQRSLLGDCLQDVKKAMEGLPRELALDLHLSHSSNQQTPVLADFGFGDSQRDAFDDSQFQYYPPAHPAHQPPSDIRRVIESHPERRRLLQFEIQKANIYVSQLATRSYFVERYLNLRDAHREQIRAQAAEAYGAENGTNITGGVQGGPSGDSKSVAVAALHAAAEQTDDAGILAERELIVQNLLVVLASISQRNLEPNGGSLINKIRQVASTLVHDAPDRKGPLAVRAEEPLTRFLDVLMRLEKTGAGNGGVLAGTTGHGDGVMTSHDEEQELRSWADLREHQMRFFQNGGFIYQI